MASARSHRLARYSLPDVPQPEDTVGYCVQVPNDVKHIVAFKSQIRALSRAYLWADDDDHTALLCAEAWKPTADAIDIDNPACGPILPGILCIGGSFADFDYGFVPDIAAPCSPDWVFGTGYESCTDGADNKEKLELQRIFDAQTFIRSAKFHIVGPVTQTYTYEVIFWLAGSQVYDYSTTVSGGGGDTFSQDVNQQADRVTIHVASTGETTGTHQYIDDWQLCYTGDFPLSQASPGVFSHFFDFTAGDGGWICDTAGSYYPCCTLGPSGWQDAYSAGLNGDYTIISCTLTAPRDITSVFMQETVGRTVGPIPASEFVFLQLRDPGDGVIATIVPGSTYAGPSWLANGPWSNVQRIRVGIGTQRVGGFSYCSQLIPAVTVAGVGSDPF